MNGTSQTQQMSHGELFTGITGGSVTEGVGAIATVVLAIIGLAGVFPDILAPIAAIIVGAIFLMDGIWVSAAARRLSMGATVRQTLGLGSGVTAGFFGGLAGIVLGILALFRTAPQTHGDILLAVAVLVYGAALLLGGGGLARVSWMLRHSMGEETATLTNPGASLTTGSGGVLAGLAALVLGILAVIGLVPMTLVQIGLLCLGAAALFSGASASSETV